VIRKKEPKEQILDEDGKPLEFEDSDAEGNEIEDNVVQRDDD